MTIPQKREDNPRFHPIANVFPLMEEDDFARLVKDIDDNGLADPIIMLDGKILDGRNRWLACQQLGIAHREVKFDQLQLGSDDPVTFVWSHNVVRRHLSQGQIDFAASALLELGWGSNQFQPKGAVDEESPIEDSKPKTRTQVAKETGATVKGIEKGSRVRRKGTAKVQDAVAAGDLALDTAARIASFEPEEQEEIMKDSKPSAAVARREAVGTQKTTVRKGPGPAVVMRGHMTGHQSGVRDVQLINKFWAEHKDEIENMDPADLRAFVKDLEESRRAASQLLSLLAEKLIPEWTLDGKQPALLSTALNKIDSAAKSGAEESE